MEFPSFLKTKLQLRGLFNKKKQKKTKPGASKVEFHKLNSYGLGDLDHNVIMYENEKNLLV